MNLLPQLVRTAFAGLLLLSVAPTPSYADPTTMTGHVELQNKASGKTVKDASNVVVWLTPVGGPARADTDPLPAQHPHLTQKNKHFEPHVLVVPVGTAVQFPNRDPFFHNVFSLFDGKRFDLGLYEAGTTRDVRFDKPGISYIFCNIHPEMSAVVVAIDTPYYAISDIRGELSIPNVPAGRYVLHVWSEASLPDELNGTSREITVSEGDGSLGVIRLTVSPNPITAEHKNKYGKDYDNPLPRSPAYNPQ
jgi:plastocyanin